MALVLSVETSTQVCSVALHQDGDLIGSQHYAMQNAHSSLIPAIIDQLLKNCGYSLDKLEAVCISSGPGSYTGLRIGLAAAKGVAFSLEIPIISISSLDLLFEQANNIIEADYYCPMIDARRMEVYCYLKSQAGDRIWDTQALIITESTFTPFPNKRIALFGSGAPKLGELLTSPNIKIFSDFHPVASAMGRLAHRKFIRQQFEDLVYFEPNYLKDFRTNLPS